MQAPLGELTKAAHFDTPMDVELQGWQDKLIRIFNVLFEDEEGYKDPIISTVEFVRAAKDMLLAWARAVYRFVKETVDKAMSKAEVWLNTIIAILKTVLSLFEKGCRRTYAALSRLMTKVFDKKIDPIEDSDHLEAQTGGCSVEDTWCSYGTKVIDLVMSFITSLSDMLNSVFDQIPKMASKFSDCLHSMSRIVSSLKNLNAGAVLKRCVNCIYFFFTGKNWFFDIIIIDSFTEFQNEYTYEKLVTLDPEELKRVEERLHTLYVDVLRYDSQKFNTPYNALVKLIKDAKSDKQGREFLKTLDSLNAKLTEFEALKTVDYKLNSQISNLFRKLGLIYDVELSCKENSQRYMAALKRASERVGTSMAAIAGSCRIKPVVVCIRGAAGCGKTRTLKALMEDIPQRLKQHYSRGAPPSLYGRYEYHAMHPVPVTYTCTEDPEKFDSTYARQMFVVFNELHSHVVPTSRQKWAEKFVAFTDDSPLNLKRAFGDKGQVYMVSPFVFASGNFDEHTIIMNDANAQFRRMEFDLIATKRTSRDDGKIDPRKDVRYEISNECINVLFSNETPSRFLTNAVREISGKKSRPSPKRVLQGIKDKAHGNDPDKVYLNYEDLLDLVTGVYIARLSENVAEQVPHTVRDSPNKFSHLLDDGLSSGKQFRYDLTTSSSSSDCDLVEMQGGDWCDVDADDPEGMLFEFHHFLKQNVPYALISYGELYNRCRCSPFINIRGIERVPIEGTNPFIMWLNFSRSLFSLRRKYGTKSVVTKAEFRALRRTMSYIHSTYNSILAEVSERRPGRDEGRELEELKAAYLGATPAQQKKIFTLYRKRYNKELHIRVSSVVDGKTSYVVVVRDIVYSEQQKKKYRERVAANRARGSREGVANSHPDKLAKEAEYNQPRNKFQPKARTDEYNRKRNKNQRDKGRQAKMWRNNVELQGPSDGFFVPRTYAHDKYTIWKESIDQLYADEAYHLDLRPLFSEVRTGWFFWRTTEFGDCFYRDFRTSLSSLYYGNRFMLDNALFFRKLFSHFGAHFSAEEMTKLLSYLIITRGSWRNVTRVWKLPFNGELFIDAVLRKAIALAKTDLYSSTQLVNFIILCLFSVTTPETLPSSVFFDAALWIVTGENVLGWNLNSNFSGAVWRESAYVEFENVDCGQITFTGGAALRVLASVAQIILVPYIIVRGFTSLLSYFEEKEDVFLDQDLVDKLQILSEKHGYEISIRTPGQEAQVYFAPEHQMKGKARDVLAAIRTKHGMKPIELQGCMSSPTLAKIVGNQYHMFSESGVPIASLCFLYGTSAIMNKHVYASLPHRFVCVPYETHVTGKHINVIKNDMQFVEVEGGYPDDCVVVSVPGAQMHPNITSLFHNKTQPGSNGHYDEAYMSYFDASVSLRGDVQAVSSCERVIGPQNMNGLGAIPFTIENTVRYRWAGTRKSTCGSLLLGYYGHQWFILGMHTAGQPSGGIGYSTYLGDRKYSPILPPVEKQGVDLNAYFSINHFQDPVLPSLLSFSEGEIKCAVTTSPYTPSNIVRTPYDPDSDYPFEPAHIGKESYEKALVKEKASALCEQPCFAYLDVLREYKDEILEKALPGWRKILPTNLTRSTCDAVLRGDDGNEKFDPHSAKGIRLEYLRMSKLSVFEENSPDRKRFVELVDGPNGYWAVADKTLEFSAQIGHDKQKVEVRDRERVQLKKTRIFNITDFFDNVMIRQAIGPIVRHYPPDSVHTPMTCGIDPRSLAWTLLARPFVRMKKVLSMDVSGFEYIVTLLVSNLLDPVICHCFSSWRDRFGAKWAFASITQAIRFAFGKGRILWHGNTSGNWATTWLNSFQCAVYFSTATIVLAILHNDDPDHMLRSLRLKVYSDDNISALPAPWWTENNVSVVFRKYFGVILTNTDKTEISDVVTNHTIHTIDFLGRSFREEDGVFYAPLELGRLLAQLYYVKVPKKEKGNPSYVLDQLQVNVDNVCSELSEYPIPDIVRLRDEIGSKLRAMGTFVALSSTPMQSYRKVANY
jgi:hypothetical protein